MMLIGTEAQANTYPYIQARPAIVIPPRGDPPSRFPICAGPMGRTPMEGLVEVRQDQAAVEHEASTSRISEEQLFYMQQRGLPGARPAPQMGPSCGTAGVPPCGTAGVDLVGHEV